MKDNVKSQSAYTAFLNSVKNQLCSFWGLEPKKHINAYNYFNDMITTRDRIKFLRAQTFIKEEKSLTLVGWFILQSILSVFMPKTNNPDDVYGLMDQDCIKMRQKAVALQGIFYHKIGKHLIQDSKLGPIFLPAIEQVETNPKGIEKTIDPGLHILN